MGKVGVGIGRNFMYNILTGLKTVGNILVTNKDMESLWMSPQERITRWKESLRWNQQSWNNKTLRSVEPNTVGFIIDAENQYALITKIKKKKRFKYQSAILITIKIT